MRKFTITVAAIVIFSLACFVTCNKGKSGDDNGGSIEEECSTLIANIYEICSLILLDTNKNKISENDAYNMCVG